ncbi:YbgC/FadM family acyl-CoA thioesterase [Sphingosinicella microcystinivorans]|uniref:Acyl-CoA thioester hydrolase n=1 Tax=Sphingosinicella microcystinivorans TaxID=335406 RepID=A0AAD1D527_SPHMI|nr:YbgC/FadM family acyl-CoA thioesterase [Sphingosinicella microcystinivorans]RKS90544.1 acyl-CoA thioester hydrolase [Sphingosinicella microcystinivorans]BBE33459.1 tol-pal system-associated acyl-CoA thioesterase [Sphingosinicella microcystinivorans]
MTGETTSGPASGAFVDGVHRFPVRVYFEDTDLSGVVYHANYLRFMERARSDMLRVAGIDQRAFFEADEGAYAVTDLHIRYVRPARLDDVLHVESRVKSIGAASCRIAQVIVRSGELVTDALVTAALVGRDGRPKRQPPEWRRIFEELAVKAGNGEPDGN